MTINGIDPERWGAKLTADYTVGMPELDTQTLLGRNSTTFAMTSQILGMREITLPFVIAGRDHADIMLRKSYMDRLMLGKCELFLPDGFYYSAVLDTFDDPAFQGPQLAECEYTLTGMRHGPLIEVTANTVYCESSMPYTDCRLTAKVSQVSETYELGGAVFRNVQAGDVLCFDGIDKRVLINGAPGAQRCEFLSFPSLVPGENRFDTPDPVTVAYYPAYL